MFGEKEELWNHINLLKYDAQSNSGETSDFYLPCEKRKGKGVYEHEVWDFRSFQTIENCRKGVMMLQVVNKANEESNSLYKILLIDLAESNKPQGENEKNVAKVLTTIDLDC